jgi:hypothetical protein
MPASNHSALVCDMFHFLFCMRGMSKEYQIPTVGGCNHQQARGYGGCPLLYIPECYMLNRLAHKEV